MGEIEAQLKKFQKELSAGTVSLALLAVLAQAAEPLYGYLIAKRLEQVGEGVLSGKQSALYPVLRNLEAAGLLESHVEPSVAGPPGRLPPERRTRCRPMVSPRPAGRPVLPPVPPHRPGAARPPGRSAARRGPARRPRRPAPRRDGPRW